MSVALVLRRQFHIIAIRDAAEAVGIGRSLEGVTLENDGPVRHHGLARILFIEPGSVRVHAVVTATEATTREAEYRYKGIVEQIVRPLCQMRMTPGKAHADIYRELRRQPLQPRHHIAFVREDVDMQAIIFQSLGSPPVTGAGRIMGHLT